MLQISRALRQGNSGSFVTQTKVSKTYLMRQFEITFFAAIRSLKCHNLGTNIHRNFQARACPHDHIFIQVKHGLGATDPLSL